MDIPTLLEHLRRAANEERARPALTFYRGRAAAGRLTYGELLGAVAGTAHTLRAQLGVRPGDRVAVLSPNRLEVPVLFLAIMSLGATVVPLNPGAPADDWSYVLAHSGARGLFATRALLERTEGFHVEFARSIEDALSSASPEVVALAEPAAHPAVVLYTSGTTGAPKGVALGQRSILANAWSLAQHFGLSRTTQLAVLPLYHAHAFGFGFLTSLLTGGHLVFTERFNPFSWAELVRREAVTLTSVVPTLLPLLAAARVRRPEVPTLRGVLVSSAPLNPTVARAFEEATAIPLTHGWGLSEYTNFACCLPLEGELGDHHDLLYGAEVPSVGGPLAGAAVSVRDDLGHELPEGARGELWVRGPSLMQSYFRDPDATGRAIVGGWLRTGDEGCYREHRGRPMFYVTGRLKEIIIRGGEKVSPVAVERRLLAHLPELDGRLAVLGYPHRLHGEEIGAYVQTDARAEDPSERLLSAARALPVDLQPRVIVCGPAPIPRTHTGKVQRAKLRELFAGFEEYAGAAKVVARG